MPIVSLASLNAMNTAEFTRALDGIYERSPWVPERAHARAPFRSLDALASALSSAVRTASAGEQLALIRAHPDLAGKAALAGDLTEESRGEQAGAGLDRLTAAEYERFHRLNDAYRERFAFPFILAVKGHTKDGILASFEERLENDVQAERERALAEIDRIARFRLEDRLEADALDARKAGGSERDGRTS